MILTIISWYYHIAVFGRVRFTSGEKEFNAPVSLVIAARNELKNLQENLPLWLNQNYPSYEVIIADDGSTDGSSEWLVEQTAIHSKLKLVTLDSEYVKMHGKKIALTLAFKKATHSHFILTDADCTPAGENWISSMVAGFTGGKQVVIGYSPYQKLPGLLNSLIRYETLTTALQYLGFALCGKPYMGVGRNIAYSRELYNSVNGFSSHSHIPAGDDDLFVQSAGNSRNTAVIIHPEAFVYSKPKTSFKSWFRQKNRHTWVGKFYTADTKKMLAVLPLVQWFLTFTLIFWMIFGSAFWYSFVVLVFKFIPEWWIKGRKAAMLKSGDLIWKIPLLSAINQVLYLILGIIAFFAKRPKW